MASPTPLMIVISYRGCAAALAGPECFYLAPHIAERLDGDSVKRFVCFLVLYARDVLTGELPDEPRRYLPARAERYARACLIAPRAFLALAGLPDAELAEHFGVPLEQDPQATRRGRPQAASPAAHAALVPGRRRSLGEGMTRERPPSAATPRVKERRAAARGARWHDRRGRGGCGAAVGGDSPPERLAEALRAWADELGRLPRSLALSRRPRRSKQGVRVAGGRTNVRSQPGADSP